MSVSYYDLLDVDESADAGEIRVAWRSAVSGLDPTDRRFRAYNTAGEVLLDPDRRQAYDEELAALREQESARAAEESEATATPAATAAATEDPAADAPTRTGKAVKTGKPGKAGKDGKDGTARRVPPWWLVALAGAVALVMLLVAGYLTARLVSGPSDEDVESSARQAQGAAEQAVTSVLAFDAGDVAGTRAEALPYLSGNYRNEYLKFFDGVMAENAPSTGTRVQVEVVASGIVRSGTDRTDVLVFVDRPTTNNQSEEPVVYKDQVTLQMKKVGEKWLVNGMETTPLQ